LRCREENGIPAPRIGLTGGSGKKFLKFL